MDHKALPVLPVSDLRMQAKQILDTIKEQPVIITQRGRAHAVLLSYDLYNAMIARIENLENLTDAALLKRARETSQGTAPAQALLDQFGRLFREPEPRALPAPIPLVAREARATYTVRKNKSRGKRRANG